MPSRAFRFAVVAALPSAELSWAEIARRVEGFGYSTLQVPDTLGTLATFPALAAAATATTTLRVGAYVIAAPNHRPAAVAHEALSVDVLSGGRLELGLGAGRPESEHEAAALGLPFGTPADRMALLRETVREVRERFAKPQGPLHPVQQPHPPITIAATGPRMLRLAAEEADVIALGLSVETTPDELAARTAELREYAGAERFDRIELAYSLAVVGREVSPWMRRWMGADPDRLLELGAVAAVDGTPAEMADTLRRHRDRTGVSYFQVSEQFAQAFAPVVELLAGT
jgi:probable F420-dependent oxidoreductase